MPNSFLPLWRDICTVVKGPLGQVSFWAYLLLGIIIFGGAGVWFELWNFFQHHSGASGSANLLYSICTYFPAIAGAASFQIIIGEERRYFRSFAVVTLAILMIFDILLFTDKVFSTFWSFFVALFATVVSVLLWWIANGHYPGFYDTAADAPLGGSTSAAPAGSTAGFKTD